MMSFIYRLIVTIGFILISSSPILTFAQGINTMRNPESLNILAKIIQQTAKQQGITINEIKWSETKDKKIIATIHYEGINKQIIFNKLEIEKINKDHIPADILQKIQESISQFPGRDWPPGIKK